MTAEKKKNTYVYLGKLPQMETDADDSLEEYRSHFVPSDLREFPEQGEILEWDHSNKNYILTHSVLEWISGSIKSPARSGV